VSDTPEGYPDRLVGVADELDADAIDFAHRMFDLTPSEHGADPARVLEQRHGA
jgi:hypothetical protein